MKDARKQLCTQVIWKFLAGNERRTKRRRATWARSKNICSMSAKKKIGVWIAITHWVLCRYVDGHNGITGADCTIDHRHRRGSSAEREETARVYQPLKRTDFVERPTTTERDRRTKSSSNLRLSPIYRRTPIRGFQRDRSPNEHTSFFIRQTCLTVTRFSFLNQQIYHYSCRIRKKV